MKLLKDAYLNGYLRKVSMLGILFCTACASPKYTFHTKIKATECKEPITRRFLVESLMKRGYLHSAIATGPVDVFHKPQIEKLSVLASEPYADNAGDFGVAVCSSSPVSYVITEETRSCPKSKNCTERNQVEIQKFLSDNGCKIEPIVGRGESFKVEERQDWHISTCANIAEGFKL